MGGGAHGMDQCRGQRTALWRGLFPISSNSVCYYLCDALTSFSLVFLIWEREISNVSLIRVVSQLKEAYLQLLELMTQTCNFSTQEAC